MDRRTEDLRVLRTHTLLLRALSDLLQEKPFDEIRVKDLCQRAMVHRSTFYAHFEDKRHLLTFGMQAFLDDLTDGMPCSDNPAPLSPRPSRRCSSTSWHAGRSMPVLFPGPPQRRSQGNFPGGVCPSAHRADPAPPRLHCLHPGGDRGALPILCRGLLSLITWWLKPGTQRSVEEVAEAFCNVYILHAPIPVPEASQDTPAPKPKRPSLKTKRTAPPPD